MTPAAMSQRIDTLINARIEQDKLTTAEPASDTEFLRRAYLDLTGRIPRVSETRAFLADSQPQRRSQLIATLLTKPRYATHLATNWRRFLLPDSGADVARLGSNAPFETWLRQRFNDNTPYNELTRDIVLAEGQAGQGATLFFTSLENKPEALAAATSRAFLGVQIECAQCHDHPHDKWKQGDFWGYAAFFARLPRQAEGLPGATLADADSGEVTDPKTNQVVPPRYLLGDVAQPDPGLSRRQQLVHWLTADQNPYFARATVNRLWAQLFGRGLVEPVDDLGDHNPPSHPELMDELTVYFIATNYDVRNLLSVLANTQAYQRTSMLRDGETPTPPETFARMAIKSLSAEQLYDCLAVATYRRDNLTPNMRDNPLGFDTEKAAFLEKFRAPQGSTTEFHGGIPQALTLMNGKLLTDGVDASESGLLGAVSAPFFSDAQRVETLFLATLSRPPSPEEEARFVSYLESKLTNVERQRALRDVLWALLNSAEFALNH